MVIFTCVHANYLSFSLSLCIFGDPSDFHPCGPAGCLKHQLQVKLMVEVCMTGFVATD